MEVERLIWLLRWVVQNFFTLGEQNAKCLIDKDILSKNTPPYFEDLRSEARTFPAPLQTSFL